MVCGINMEATGKRLDDLRMERNLTIKDIQNHFGFATPSGIYKWMRGTALPCIDNLVVLADLYQCTVDDMLVCEQF